MSRRTDRVAHLIQDGPEAAEVFEAHMAEDGGLFHVKRYKP